MFLRKMILYMLAGLTIVATAQAQKFDPQAHRGGRGIMPENTVASMKYALDLGCTLEMDLSFTKDKKIVVSHDNYISSVFARDSSGKDITKEEEKKYRLYNLNYDEIKKFDVGMRPHPLFPQQKKIPEIIPLFKDLLDSVEAYAKSKHLSAPRYNIEAKLAVGPNSDTALFRKEFINNIMRIILKKGIQKRVMIQSFDVGMLQILHHAYPKILTSYLVSKGDLEGNLKKLKFNPSIYSPLYTMVTKELVDECHQRKMRIIPWTVNTKKEIEDLKALGVDGIITDFPELF